MLLLNMYDKYKNWFDRFDTVSIPFTISVVPCQLSILNLVCRVFQVKRNEMIGVCCYGS